MDAGETVYIVEDDESMRTALARLLRATGHAVQGYDSAQSFLAAFDGRWTGCILLDIGLPGMDGMALQERLNDLGCTLPIVFLTAQGDIPASVRAIKAGAEDFLCKPVEKERLLGAVERALARHRRDAHALGARRALAQRFAGLTAREREVFALLITGALNKQIADKLGNSERTVKAHRRAILDKLGVRSVAELVLIDSQLSAR